jgi:LysM repeat protein
LAAGARASHFAAPAAFLLVVTIAVLLVRGSLHRSPSKPPAATTSGLVTTTHSGATTRGHATTAVSAAQYYKVAAGDTLGSIAYRYHTTVEKLLALNPGVQPTALHIGQRVRVH